MRRRRAASFVGPRANAEGRCKAADAIDGERMMPDRSEGRGGRTSLGLSGVLFDCGALAALALTALAVGGLVNALRAEPLPWVYVGRAKTLDATVAELTTDRPAVPATPPQEIRLEDFQSFVLEGKGPVLDARAKSFYDLAHVPGAVSLPRGAFGEDYPPLREKLDAYRDRPVAVYCSSADCPDAQLVADALAKLGYRHLLIYTSGWEEWSQTGLPQEGSAAQP